VRFLEGDAADLFAWLQGYSSRFPWIYSPHELTAAARSRHLFAVLTVHDAIVGYIKLGVGGTYIHDFDGIVEVPAGHGLIYDTFVLPEFRGKGLAAFVLSETLRQARVRGLAQVWCHIEAWNAASLALYRHAGFAPVDRIRFSRVLGLPLFVHHSLIPIWNLGRFLARHPVRESTA
jgi:ribosomal protein S18 acetylase RimI-like enzyme